MKKFATTVICTLIILVCFGAIGFIIFMLQTNPPTTVMEVIGCVLMLAFPGIIIYITGAGLHEYLGGNAKKVATKIICTLIALICFGAVGYMVWMIYNNLPNTIMEIIGCVLMLTTPGLIIYITVGGLFEYLKEI